MPKAAAAVELRDVRVQFGAVVANDAVSFSAAPGEIHALLGENGAGKTTLVRVLSGLLQPQAGQVLVNGVPTILADPQTANHLGIGVVHQHFMLVDTMTVAENIAIGLPGLRRWFPDLDHIARTVEALGAAHGLAIDGKASVRDLSVAGQQRVEIIRALYRGARILVLDEPTAVLTPQETAALFPILRSLAQAGTTIIFISHKLHEVMALTDRITVLRRGRVVGTLDTDKTSQPEIAHLMVGEDVELPKLTGASAASGAVLEVRDLSYRDRRGIARLSKVSLSVGRGEIVGVAGVDGNGQQELAEAIVGLVSPDAGAIRLEGKDLTKSSVAVRIAAGMAHIPEDRLRTAIFASMSVRDNVVAELAGSAQFASHGLQKADQISRYAERVVADYDVRLDSIAQPMGNLSGGNQQKVVLGRSLLREPQLIVAVQPTRGLDIGATAFLQRQLLARREAGAGILLVSTELEEVMALSDRIVVMFGGAVVGELQRSAFSTERLGLMMAGAA